MGQEGGIELRNLLSPAIKLILVKGAPGTGKTTLAARLMEFVDSGAYISTRVGIQKLSGQNKRLLPRVKRGKFDELSLESAKTDYEDMRLATPKMVLDEILKATKRKKDLIVLDSWDSMAKGNSRYRETKARRIDSRNDRFEQLQSHIHQRRVRINEH